jgi:hypothetical protein
MRTKTSRYGGTVYSARMVRLSFLAKRAGEESLTAAKLFYSLAA